jgi:hypothetical protein
MNSVIRPMRPRSSFLQIELGHELINTPVGWLTHMRGADAQPRCEAHAYRRPSRTRRFRIAEMCASASLSASGDVWTE